VAHHADGFDGEEYRERLPQASLEPGTANLFLHDGVGFAEQIEPVCRHLAEDADREPRARERLTPDDLGRKPQELSELSHLLLQELAEWLAPPALAISQH